MKNKSCLIDPGSAQIVVHRRIFPQSPRETGDFWFVHQKFIYGL